jgi:pimeloyl-ACP methyl ester carboxylesterase
MNDPTITKLSVNGVTIAETTAGDGNPLLMLHGWGASLRLVWPLAAQMIPLGYRVFVPDMPGFGESDLPPSAWSIYDYAAFVIAYMDAHGLEQVNLFGHSFGGRLGLILGAEHGERILKMALADSAGLREPSPASSQMRVNAYKSVRDGLAKAGMKGLSDKLRGWYTERYASTDYKNAGPLRETFVKVINEDLAPYAARVKPPTLLFWGDQDAETPLSMGQALEKLIPDAGLIVFPGAGHYSYLDNLGETVRIMHHFFSH